MNRSVGRRGPMRAHSGAVALMQRLLDAFWIFFAHYVSYLLYPSITRGLARVLAPRVRVNAVAPGTVLLPEGWNEASARRLVETTPLRRWGTPADVVQAVLYLLDAGYVTGETIIVDGGRHVRR